MNIEALLNNPELAKHIRFEITGSDMLELAATLIKSTRESKNENKDEVFLTRKEVCDIVQRDKVTLWRWAQKKILVPNQLGMYKKSDIDNFLSKQ